ncbi:ficolin-1-like isoform X1 [Drosophila innubila]|uniref:ficolin-1-like isoform X1 n=1 Tax=Drosophila innubila TaxID=198719 RepID=UPI00148CE4E5|nr:ficolin-1-like isoform X1 [Drosophila innubila]
MLWNIIFIILVINSLSSFSQATQIFDRNEPSSLPSICDNLRKMRAELERHLKDALDMKTDIQFLKAISGDIKYLRTQLEEMNTDTANKQTDIQQLRAELEQQQKYGVEQESDIKHLRTELEQQKKDGVAQASDIIFLRTELERQRILVDRLVNPHNCTEAKSNGINEILLPNFSNQHFKVACDAETQGGGWTIILRRMDGSVNFYRNWTEYKNGFGDLNGEFFLGLDKIHVLTKERKQELLVVLVNFAGLQKYELYDDFAIGNEDQKYDLRTLGEASGTAGDSLSFHRGKEFSTYDRKDVRQRCAETYNGAWWYGDDRCHESQLTGKYNDNRVGKGVNWISFGSYHTSYKRAVMMIRPTK